MLNERNTLLEDDGIEEEILVEEECSVAQAVWGDIQGNIENQTDLQNALDAKQDSLTEAQLNAVNSGINSTKVETYDGYQAQINTKASQSALEAESEARRQADSTLQGNIDAEETARKASDKDIQDVLDGETLARQNADTALGGRIDTEIHNRQVADIGLQGQIDAITSKSDVVDVVATYADLQAYDTQHLGDNDVIKVLDDETHGDALTYYRWSKTNQTWTFIGQEAPYYSKSQTDTLLLGKQNTIDSSHKLSADLVDDTSTTNKFVTASDITNWNAKQDALTAGTGIDITSGIISTPAIVPEVVTELPTTGAEGKLYLTPKAHTIQTATGNPITATITDDAGQMESFQLDGDTFQQTYTGKNLFDKDNYSILNCWPTSVLAHGNNWSIWIPCEPNTTYSVTKMICQPTDHNRFKIATTAVEPNYGVAVVDAVNPGTDSTTGQITTGETAKYLMVVLANTDTAPTTTLTEMLSSVQIELGSTATAYEPYVGGTASPNPDYPQQIQTVTGTQTISINGTNYPLDLGDIQLCGLGDDGNGNPLYKDRIYRDGDDWKVHKAIGHDKKIVSLAGIDGYSSVYGTATTSNGAFAIISTNWGSDYATTAGLAIASSVIGVYQSQNIDGNNAANSMTDGTFCQRSGTNDRVYFRFASWARSKTVNEVNQMVTDNGGIDLWYPLTTPTDTTITDTTLIAQLEAIRTASLQNGANTITNTATGSNLAGDMEIGYYGFNPRNRYDKWLWLDINNNYEQIGGE